MLDMRRAGEGPPEDGADGCDAGYEALAVLFQDEDAAGHPPAPGPCRTHPDTPVRSRH